ncbi:Wall-associated receptor kinase-like [Actinidia chinensis var. chinensis]|uniref:Wall-associated receptor kinase-like n=1 Tax=Actinidia chinensis var. chinensis TaxID=1590841 RepID=A0A2R6PAL3_ACTCC|nr:Wall-associated receptor kinase-like [Actinidia chinensis var. chinensis]
MALELIVVILQMTTLLLLLMTETTSAQNRSLAKPGCPERCGNVSVPYPFGIGAGCSINETFSVECRNTTYGLKPYLKRINLEVLEISLELQVRVNHPVISRSCDVDGSTVVNGSTSVDLRGSPFDFSDYYNIFISVGCNNHARMTDLDDKTIAQCISICGSSPDRDNSCFGINCCQTRIPRSNLRTFKASLNSIESNQSGGRVQPIPCTYAFLVDRDWFRSNLTDPFTLQDMAHVPAVLEWRLYSMKRSQLGIPKYKGGNCGRFWDGNDDSYGIECYCHWGYEGNPYLPHGCQDVCSYNRTHPFCRRKHKSKMIIIGVCIGSVGALLLLIATWWLYKVMKKRNGGYLQQQQYLSLSSAEHGWQEEAFFERFLTGIAHLGKRCLNLNGKTRPTTKETAIELEGIRMRQGDYTTQKNFHDESKDTTTDLSEAWDMASTSTTGNFLDSRTVSSVDAQPLLL